MAPDKEAQHADRKNRKHHRAITKDRFARERRKYVRRRPDAGQNRDVNFRMTKEPEQVLPKQRRAAGMQRHERTTDVEAAGNKEARSGDAIKQQKDSPSQEDREREESQNCRGKPGP